MNHGIYFLIGTRRVQDIVKIICDCFSIRLTLIKVRIVTQTSQLMMNMIMMILTLIMRKSCLTNP